MSASPTASTNRRERHLLACLVVGAMVAYAAFGLFQHWNFGTNYDLAIFDQAVWHMSRFEVPASTVSGYANILGDHFYPILVVLVLPYWAAPRPETLIVVQAVLLAASAIPVHSYLRRRLPAREALLLSMAYLLFWGIQRTAASDFHEMAFAPLLVATAILAIERKTWALVWVACLLLIGVKEDLIPLVAALGLWTAYSGERRQGVWLFAVGSVAFVVVVTFLIPWFNDGAWTTGGAFADVWARPWLAPVLLVSPPQKLLTVVFWLAPFLFLSLRSPLAALIVPVAAERLLSSLSTHWGWGLHYSAPLAPIIAMSAGDGLARLLHARSAPALGRTAASWLAGGCVLLCAFAPGHQPIWELLSPGHYRARPAHESASAALAVVPRDASVVAQTALLPHLGHRNGLYVLDADAPEADYVIAAEPLSPWPEATPADIARLVGAWRARGYVVVFDDRGWVVLRKPAP